MINEVGFPWAMRTAAFLILFMMIIANLTITSRMPPARKPVEVMEFIRPLKELPFDLVCAGAFVFFLGMFLPINYIILEASHYGMDPGLAQYLVSILNAASFFGRTLPGYIADKIGRFNMVSWQYTRHLTLPDHHLYIFKPYIRSLLTKDGLDVHNV